jgi:hypothetical protein
MRQKVSKEIKKTKKYCFLVTALKKYWERMEFVAIPIGHAGTTLTRTLDHLTAAFSTVRPSADHANANTDTPPPPRTSTLSDTSTA